MKKFDIELSKGGYPVETSDGCPVKIIEDSAEGKYPIVALVRTEANNGTPMDVACQFDIEGQPISQETCHSFLVMKTKKKWVKFFVTKYRTIDNIIRAEFFDSEEEMLAYQVDEDYEECCGTSVVEFFDHKYKEYGELGK
jgi:hypothetical protein